MSPGGRVVNVAALPRTGTWPPRPGRSRNQILGLRHVAG